MNTYTRFALKLFTSAGWGALFGAICAGHTPAWFWMPGALLLGGVWGFAFDALVPIRNRSTTDGDGQ